MSHYQWSEGSLQGQALAAARRRRAEQRRMEEERREQAQRAREEHFKHLLANVYGENWPRSETELRRVGTQARIGELLFELQDTPGEEQATLLVSAICRNCQQSFKRHSVQELADVGEVLEELQHHPDCVHPEVRAEVERQKRLARHALNL